jgi:hypothetical protein
MVYFALIPSAGSGRFKFRGKPSECLSMIEQSVQRPRAGWYEDPTDMSKVRWWDGAAWTWHIQGKP